MTSVRKNNLSASDLTDSLKKMDKKRRRQRTALANAASLAPSRRNDLSPTLEVVYRQLESLKAPPRTLRRQDLARVRALAAAIASLGICLPLLIDVGNVVIDGLARLEAAKLLGLSQLPCIEIHHLSADERRVLRIAVNRLAEKGKWDLTELKLEFEELRLVDAPLEVTGFSLDEIDQIVICDDGEGVETGPLEPEDVTQAIARVGDIFQFGPHRVFCGDARDPSIIEHLMRADEETRDVARLVLTDPPYNVKIAGNVTRSGHREFAMASGELSDAEFLDFNSRWIEAALPYLCDGGVLAPFIDWRGVWTVHQAATKSKLTLLNLVVWSKTNAGMGSLYRSAHELLPLFKKGEGAHINNVELGRRGRWRSNVWTHAGASSLGSDARRGLKVHPTVKPTDLLKEAMLDLTHRGDIVLDPFLGSGSTLLAAHKAGRVCRGVELDPIYVDVIVQRFEKATGAEVRHVESGETYINLKARRLFERSQQSGCGGADETTSSDRV